MLPQLACRRPDAQADEAQHGLGEDRLRHAVASARMMIGPAALGSRCWTMMRGAGAPSERAALTKSRSRSVSNWPRTSRARSVQLTRPIARKMLKMLAPMRGGNDDHEQQVGKRVEDVGEAHQPVVDAAAEEAGEAAHGQADDQDQDLDKNRHRQRHARAVNQAAEQVAADVVGAHQVGSARLRVRAGRELEGRVVQRQDVGEDAPPATMKRDEHQAGHGQFVAQQAPPGVAPQAARRARRDVDHASRAAADRSATLAVAGGPMVVVAMPLAVA